MNEELSIKVHIVDRIYPLKVKPEEEEKIRIAAKMINDKIREYKEQFLVDDKQALLSMCVLQFVTELLETQAKWVAEEKEMQNRIMNINRLLDENIKNSKVV